MLRAALIQMRSTVDSARNAEVLMQAVEEASAAGATYVQTPEMTGAIQKDRAALRALLRGEEDDAIVAAASALARRFAVTLHIGSTPILRPDGMIANRAFVFGPNGLRLATYDKIHMFDVDLDNGESWRESAVYAPGDTSAVVETDFGLLGLAICYDIRFPDLFREQAVRGASVLSAPAAFTRQTGEAHWHVLQRARAIENGAFVVSAAQGGTHEDGRETYGHSLVVDPWGRIIAEADHDNPAVITADLDLELVGQARGKIPNLKNARAFETVIFGDTAEAAQ
jgi:predicted amidohydrolase